MAATIGVFMLQKLFQPDLSSRRARAFYDSFAGQALQPAFFGPGRLQDDAKGRFEILSLHAILTLQALERANETRLAQKLSDLTFRTFDDAMREMGVGDLSVPRKMKELAQGFLGRGQAYGAAWDENSDPAALFGAIARNFEAPEPYAQAVAVYCRLVVRALTVSLSRADRASPTGFAPIEWPLPPAL